MHPMLLIPARLSKAFVQGHLRHLAGRTVVVKPYHTRRTTHADDERSRELFADIPPAKNQIRPATPPNHLARVAAIPVVPFATAYPDLLAAPPKKPAPVNLLDVIHPDTLARARLPKRYTADDLRDPATYTQDAALATFARAVASNIAGGIGAAFGETKREVLAGKHADLMLAATTAVNDRTDAAQAKTEKGKKTAQTIIPPPGYTVSTEGSSIIIRGRFDQDLHDRIKRAGGRWDGATGTNRKLWIVPAAKADSLSKIFSNVGKSLVERQKAADQAQAKQQA